MFWALLSQTHQVKWKGCYAVLNTLTVEPKPAVKSLHNTHSDTLGQFRAYRSEAPQLRWLFTRMLTWLSTNGGEAECLNVQPSHSCRKPFTVHQTGLSHVEISPHTSNSALQHTLIPEQLSTPCCHFNLSENTESKSAALKKRSIF